MRELRTLRELIPSDQTTEYVSPKDGLAKAITIMQFRFEDRDGSKISLLANMTGYIDTLTDNY